MYKLINKTNKQQSILEKILNEFVPFAHKTLEFNKPVTIFLYSDEDNSKNPLGKTGYYSPELSSIVIYVDNRHPKDICRSIAHELVHHSQNCRGMFDDLEIGDGYAQKDDNLRNMEREAYEGDLIFRDWEDLKKKEPNYVQQLQEQKNNYVYNKLKKQFAK